MAARAPGMLQHKWRHLIQDPTRPAALDTCSGRCFQAALKMMRVTGRTTTTSEVRLEPANGRLAVEAVWRLLPAFHDRWGQLWDLQTLLQGVGPGPWPDERGLRALRAHDDAVAASATHHPRRTGRQRTPAPDRLQALRDHGWLEGKADSTLLAGAARDSLTLLHLVLRPELRIPPSSLERIGTVRPVKR